MGTSGRSWLSRSAGALGLAVLLVYPQAIDAANEPALTSEIEFMTDKRIEGLDRQIALEFIKLARFNIHYHQATDRRGKWRMISYMSARESGTAVSFAASLLDMKQRVRALRDEPPYKNSLRNVINLGLIGSSISGSASGLELAQNTWYMMQAKHMGYSPSEAENVVKESIRKTDELLKERDDLVALNTSKSVRKAGEVEGLYLRRIREQLLSEFRTWCSESRERGWTENTFFAIDSAQNFTRVGAFILGLRGFKHNHLGGPAAVTTLVANSAATASPLLAVLAGTAIRKHEYKKLTRELGLDHQAAVPSEALSELTQRMSQRNLPQERQAALLEEINSLSERSTRLDVSIDRENREVERRRQVAQQQAVAGPIIGLTGVAGSVLGTTAFYGYRGDRATTADLLAAGRITVIAGQGIALIVTPYTMASGLVRIAKLKKRGELPSQLLEQRLKNLDDIEARIKAAAP